MTNRSNVSDPVEQYLDSIFPAQMTLGLDRITAACGELGNPQDAVPCVHVAGTNGKGSTCAFIEAILRAQLPSAKIGLFTSPHLTDVRERIQLNRELIPEDRFTQYVWQQKPLQEKYSLSYFEFLTLIGFLYFRDERVGLAIYEVGLGGRLDSTNVVTPKVSVITP